MSFVRTWDLSFDTSSSTSTFLYSMSSKMAELLKTLYVDEVYFPTPLIILYPREEEEGDITTSFEPPSPTRASRRRRRLLINEEVDEEEKGLTMSHALR